MTETTKIRFQDLSDDQKFSITDRLSYDGTDAKTEQLILQTVAQLPKEIQEFALNQCCFISVGKTVCGSVFPGRLSYHPMLNSPEGIQWAIQNDKIKDFLQSPLWVVALAENYMDSMSEADSESIIAHEIAHAWLRHDRFDLDCPHDSEKQACLLTKEWGFDGIGTDVSIQQPDD